MSDGSKAVFLSYASQDAEAARKICDTLRAAGIEVWLDQSELRGGDAWDQMISRQIKECSLFLPVISANTQARLEGYFRREWRLAVERMRDMDDEVPFLVPVVVDDTPDAGARVPERFRERQWTRLPRGETAPAFCARVKKLLAGGHDAGGSRPAIPHQTRRPFQWWWLAFPFFGLSMALILIFNPPGSGGKKAPATAAPPSEARQLATTALALINKPGAGYKEFAAAIELCAKANRLDPADGEVLATWSQACSWILFHGFDPAQERQERQQTALAKATMAQELAPSSFEARFALGFYFTRGIGGLTATSDEKAQAILQELLRERSDEPRVLLALGMQQGRSNHVEEARATLRRLAENPAYAAQAWGELGWAEMLATNYATAEAAVDRANNILPLWRNLVLKALLALEWRDDTDLASATGRRLADSIMQEGIGMLGAYIDLMRRNPTGALQNLAPIPVDWLSSPGYEGPKGVWVALAYEQLHEQDRADVQWQLALNVIDERLARTTEDRVRVMQAYVLAALNRPAEAETKLRLVDKSVANVRMPWLARGWYVLTLIRLGHADTALDFLEKDPRLTAAVLRLDPGLDPLRALPRFQALQTRLEADPSRWPNAKIAPAAGPADQKSVAVLAFANLSDDKANEYFSDGISEELLNVLAKIPELKVAARTSAFYFKGKDVPIPEIAQKLGVAYVVEGSVRKAGDKVRITAQLIKAADGFHVWSDTFTRDLK
ncbi:MAG TPA: TIR domain-containing protein, partial [Candidatus Didemnitutus sp.]|nr:TIR domain-containing protein [Candidatus Didemnitutus sp.]